MSIVSASSINEGLKIDITNTVNEPLISALPLKYSFPVGEVIGGVITSAVVIAVVALVLLFIRRRNKQKEYGHLKTL